MAIHVTCPGCFKRFSVSDKFAGRQGPCPNCKAIIKIPTKDEEVVIHAPEDSTPKDRSGRSVLKPIKRRENELTPAMWTLIGAVIVSLLVAAFGFRLAVSDKSLAPWWLFALMAFAVAIPIVIAGYGVLRDQELAPFHGKEFWLRTTVCAICYAVTWGAMPLAWYTFANTWDFTSWVSGGVTMMVVGSIAAMMCWEFGAMAGILHYGFYFGSCLLLRWIAGVGVLPGVLLDAGESTAHVFEACTWWSLMTRFL